MVSTPVLVEQEVVIHSQDLLHLILHSNGWGNDGGSGGSGVILHGSIVVAVVVVVVQVANNTQGNYGGRGMLLSPTFRDPSLCYYDAWITAYYTCGIWWPITAGQPVVVAVEPD